MIKPTLADFDLETDNTRNCSIIIAMAGTKYAMKKQLEELIKALDCDYGKPCQSVFYKPDCTVNITTPIWDGERY